MVSDKLVHEIACAEGVKTGKMAVLYVLTLYTCAKGQDFYCAATNAVFPVLIVSCLQIPPHTWKRIFKTMLATVK